MVLKGGKNIETFQTQDSPERVFTPRLQVAKTKQMLDEILRCANEDLSVVTNRKAKTLLETTIALVQGLIKAFEHYENFWKQTSKRKVFERMN